MELQLCHIKALNQDLLSDVMARLDGSTLAAAASTCSDLHDSTRHQSLWQHLCHSTWPSTALPQARLLFSSSPDFAKFYAHSFPLVSNDQSPPHHVQLQSTITHLEKPKTHIRSSDLASLVDVYYKGKCILSKILEGVPGTMDACDQTSDASVAQRLRWFSNCPFKLDLFSTDDHKNHGHANGTVDNNIEYQVYGYNHNARGGRCREDFCQKLHEDVRLSWVLFDKTKGRAVNISSWKPISVQRSWLSDGDYIMRFGCIVPMEQTQLPHHQLAECVIEARCMVVETDGDLKWREISLSVQDVMGALVNGAHSLMVLNRALNCKRTINHIKVEKGYNRYRKQKKVVKRSEEFKEARANRICVSIEITVFVAICYACTIFF